jgi:hypothetical protein
MTVRVSGNWPLAQQGGQPQGACVYSRLGKRQHSTVQAAWLACISCSPLSQPAATHPPATRLGPPLSPPALTQSGHCYADVEYAEPDYVVTPDAIPSDAQFSNQWGLTKIGAPSAWDTTTGSSVTVCVVDSGVDYT